MMIYLEILTYSNENLIVGLYYKTFGKEHIDSFSKKLMQYRQTKSPEHVGYLLKTVEKMVKSFSPLSLKEIRKEKFLILTGYQQDLNIPYPKKPIIKKQNKIIIKKQNKPNKENEYYKNIHFQKNSLEGLPFKIKKGDYYLISFFENIAYMAFTQKKERGVTYALGIVSNGAATSNLSAEAQKTIEIGDYALDFYNVYKSNNLKYYKLIKN